VIVEQGTATDVFEHPKQHYTQALLKAAYFRDGDERQAG
jgi:ABC-type microcin C transport system duplicated ATPase subunit YejF